MNTAEIKHENLINEITLIVKSAKNDDEIKRVLKIFSEQIHREAGSKIAEKLSAIINSI